MVLRRSVTRIVLVACLLSTLLGCASSSGSMISGPAVPWGTQTLWPAAKSPAASSVAAPAPSPSSAGKASSPGKAAQAASTQKLLPRGGTVLFPRYRLVGYSGGEGSTAFGRLGIGNLDARIAEIERTGRSYTKGNRQPLPVLELIAVVAQGSPGPNGQYSSRIDDAQIARYLAAARRHSALLLLNIQPGRAAFLPEVKSLSRWLVEPDVGIALDPEWAVGPHQIPGRVFGRTSAAELNAVAAYLASMVRLHRLPEKAMVVHQLAPRIIDRVQNLRTYPGVQVVLSVDGIGSPAEKQATWLRLVKPLPPGVRPGFKLFFDEDRRSHGKLMTPAQVMRLRPTPDYVLYE